MLAVVFRFMKETKLHPALRNYQHYVYGSNE